MHQSNAKENILKKIRQGLAKSVPEPFPLNEGSNNLFAPPENDLKYIFAENLNGLLGNTRFCKNIKDLTEQLNQLCVDRNWNKIYCCETELKSKLENEGFVCDNTTTVAQCDVSITGCETLVARTGSILMSSANESGRSTSVYAPVHICIAYRSQLVYNIKDGLQNVKSKYENFPSLVTLATGPSRTADIEKTLVVGIHGPKEVFCFILDEV